MNCGRVYVMSMAVMCANNRVMGCLLHELLPIALGPRINISSYMP
jgi:hypothetical protein